MDGIAVDGSEGMGRALIVDDLAAALFAAATALMLARPAPPSPPRRSIE